MKTFLTHSNKIKPLTDKASTDWIRINKTENRTAEIFIYDEISFWGVSAQDVAQKIKDLDVDHIDLRINSPGGLVFDGVAIYNLFKQHKATVNVYIDGIAASIASVIAMAGDRIYMADNAMIMIHKPLILMFGNATELRKEADVLDQIEKTLISTYRTRVDMEEDELSALLEAETWIDANTALESKFIDEITSSRKEAASAAQMFDLSSFRHTPKTWDVLAKKKAEETTDPDLTEEQNLILQNS